MGTPCKAVIPYQSHGHSVQSDAKAGDLRNVINKSYTLDRIECQNQHDITFAQFLLENLIKNTSYFVKAESSCSNNFSENVYTIFADISQSPGWRSILHRSCQRDDQPSRSETEVVAYSPPTDSILKKLPHDWIRDCTSASVSGLEA